MNRRRALTVLSAGLIAALPGSAAAMTRRPGNRYYGGPVSDHFDGRVFFNPGGEEPRGFGDLLRWRFNGQRTSWPDEWPGGQSIPEERVDAGDLRVSMVGHASMLVQVSGLNILTDPVYSDRASPTRLVGPRRVNQPGIAFDALPPIDVVLISHNHYDHLDLDTLERLAETHDPLVVTPLGNDTIIRQRAPNMRIETLDWGGSHVLGTTRIHCEPAHHWSARGIADRRMALWAAFVIETPAGKIYHIGDTGFGGGSNYGSAREKHGGFRLALLPIGAYEPRWFMGAQHQNPDEAVQGMMLSGASFAVGHHWGTFQLTDEAITRPEEDLAVALSQAGLSADRFRPMRPGAVWNIPERID